MKIKRVECYPDSSKSELYCTLTIEQRPEYYTQRAYRVKEVKFINVDVAATAIKVDARDMDDCHIYGDAMTCFRR